MKTLSKRLSFIIGILVFSLILSASIVSAQNGKGKGNPPNEPKQQQNQHEVQNQNQSQNQDCVNDCVGTEQQNQNQVQNTVNDGKGTQAQNQHQYQYQYLLDTCVNCPLLDGIALEEEVVAAMEAGLLDEYTAYAIYSAIIEQLGELIPFSNIQDAEATHIWVWEKMFDKYGLILPESPTVEVPTFETVADACAYALNIETDNVALYDDLLAAVADYTNLTQLVRALQSASLNHHIPALEACAGI